MIDRDDALARGLRAAERKYEEDDAVGARTTFQEILAENPDSIEAQIGDAVTAWPEETEEKLQAIVDAYPDSAVARLNLGLALLAQGEPNAARKQWAEAERARARLAGGAERRGSAQPALAARPAAVRRRGRAGRRSPSSPLEERLETVRGTPRSAAPSTTGSSTGARSRRWATANRHGVPTQTRSRPTRRASRRRSPPRCRRFDKDDASPAFAKLGPLASANPNSSLIRFHLGLMLLWLPDLDNARKQLERAQVSDQEGFYGKQAGRVLARLAQIE